MYIFLTHSGRMLWMARKERVPPHVCFVLHAYTFGYDAYVFYPQAAGPVGLLSKYWEDIEVDIVKLSQSFSTRLLVFSFIVDETSTLIYRLEA